MKTPSIIVSSSSASLPIARALVHELEPHANVVLWTSQPSNVPSTPLESFEAAAQRADAAVFVVDPDDVLTSRGRTNVFLELGFFIGRFGRAKTFIVAPHHGTNLPPSLAGVPILHYDINVPKAALGVSAVAATLRSALTAAASSEAPGNYRCFISHTAVDRDFALKLGVDLGSAGFQCWLDTKDIPIGADWRREIRAALEASDKILLILSRESIRSEWVRIEARHAMEIEGRRRKPFLLPLRLDDAVLAAETPEAAELRTRQIADFRNWDQPEAYQQALSQLVRTLMVSRSVEAASVP